MRCVVIVVLLSGLGAGLAAQSAPSQLGLTETTAREFVLNEIKGPALDRGSDIDEQLAGIEQMRQAAEQMPPRDRAAILESVKKTRAQLTDPNLIKQMEAGVAADRARTINLTGDSGGIQLVDKADQAEAVDVASGSDYRTRSDGRGTRRR